ncbi:MAG: DUF3276 family protein [Anaerolineales bacterium]|nr:DUF3276 family protein [Anaerolineales bacterium]
MQDKKVSKSGSDSKPGFTTIDDVIQLAQELMARLSQLGEYKHPLMVRRGRKGVVNMVERNEDSMTVKAGSKTYFFDIKQTKEGKPYLVITESRFKGEGNERERISIAVFPEYAESFLKALEEMVLELEG